MSADALLVQLRSLEVQLAMLRAQIKQTEGARRPLASFYGVLAHVAETTEQELEAAELKIKADFA